jgi:hypothetical protein
MKDLVETMHTIEMLLKDVPVLGLYIGANLNIHLSKTIFLETFKEYETVGRDSDLYPFEFVAWSGDIKFFCVVEGL